MGKSRIAIGLAVALAALGTAVPAAAQDQDQAPRPAPHRRPPLRIVITPTRPAQRQCADWHVIERRASGDTVVPRMHCWWVAR